SPQHSAESGSLSYGPPVRLRLLSTSPHGDAVTFDYEVMACLDADLHRADVMPSRAHGLRPTPERRSSVAHRHEKAARFEFGEAQLHRRPGGGRDPGKKRRARRAEAWTPAYAGATKVGYHSIAKIIAKSCALAICRDSKTSSSRRRPGSRQEHGALCAQRPALRPTPERRRWVCSPGVGKLPGAFP